MRLVVAVLGLLILAPAASAAHPRPRSAAPPTASRTSRQVVRGPRLRLRLRVRPGQHLPDRRGLRDGPRRALALLRARRELQPRQRRRPPTTSTPTSSSSRSSTQGGRERLLAEPPPNGPLPEVKQGVRGYVAGYNRYLEDSAADGITDPACKGKPLGAPDHREDAYRRFYQLALLASQDVAIDGIGGAQPPTPGATGAGGPPTADADARSSSATGCRSTASARTPSASAARTRPARRGLLLGNPHFPWLGTERFYQAQLRDPRQGRRAGRACSACRWC